MNVSTAWFMGNRVRAPMNVNSSNCLAVSVLLDVICQYSTICRIIFEYSMVFHNALPQNVVTFCNYCSQFLLVYIYYEWVFVCVFFFILSFCLLVYSRPYFNIAMRYGSMVVCVCVMWMHDNLANNTILIHWPIAMNAFPYAWRKT